MHARTLSRRGFALRDAVTLAALAGVALALLTPVATYGAGQSRLQVCMGRLKDLAKTSAMFANDHQGQIASLESCSGQQRRWRTLGVQTYAQTAQGDMNSAIDGAVDIIQARGARADFGIVRSQWAPWSYYSTLVLADYNGEDLPSPQYACPEDANLLAWQSDPRNFNNLGVPSPVPSGRRAFGFEMRWPYSSSYGMAGSLFSADEPDGNQGCFWTFNDATSFVSFGAHLPGDVGRRRYDQAAFPSAKVHFADRGARHFTPRAVYWGFAEAKQPILYLDGVVRTTRTGATDPGWNWTNPRLPGSYPYQVNFTAPLFDWHPGRPDGETRTTVQFPAAYWWTTRHGLAGRDLPAPR